MNKHAEVRVKGDDWESHTLHELIIRHFEFIKLIPMCPICIWFIHVNAELIIDSVEWLIYFCNIKIFVFYSIINPLQLYKSISNTNSQLLFSNQFKKLNAKMKKKIMFQFQKSMCNNRRFLESSFFIFYVFGGSKRKVSGELWW